MARPSTVRIPVESLTIARKTTIVLVGNPNSGKSTVFNRLTGLRQKTANFPGVTVEKRIGRLTLDGSVIDLVDLPGTYSLSWNSDDERIAVDVLLGRVAGTPLPDVILAVEDATRLSQGRVLSRRRPCRTAHRESHQGCRPSANRGQELPRPRRRRYAHAV